MAFVFCFALQLRVATGGCKMILNIAIGDDHMASVRGCNLPDDLYYHVEDNVWARLEADGTITIGMTSYACTLAGQLVAATTKKIGKQVEQGKTVCTVESGKWVGPVKAPVGGRIGRDQRSGQC